MKFNELEKIMNSKGVITLAEISRALETTPQAVSNWKARDQVPYHIAAKINNTESNTDQPNMINRKQPNPFNPKFNEEKTLSLSDILLIFAEQIKVIFIVLFISVFLSFTYVKYIKEPKYVSSATILLPQQAGPNMGGLAGIASQFGVNVPSGVQADLSSPLLLPDLLKSRTFAETILDKSFYTKKFGKKLPLLAILTHGESKPQVGRDTLITRALNKLSAILEFDLDLTSSISVIKVYTEEPLFSKTLADVTLDELENLNRYYKSQTVNEKTNFILTRIQSVEEDLLSSETKLKEFNENNRQISSPSLQLELDRLTREVEVQKGIFLTLKQQYELAKIEEIQETSIIQILDKPQVPLGPSNINLLQTIIVSSFLGIALGALLGFLRSLLVKNDIDERKKIRRVKHFIKKKTKDIFYDIRVSNIITGLLLLGMPIYFTYRSDNPAYFGMYSTKVMILNSVYLLTFFIFLRISISLNRKNKN
tara:strand:+ start:1114 stop:2556 length:1443 start_codon:yes stop_codon:yes gene_type:complete